MRILLVEPESARGLELASIFRDLNYEVVPASSAKEASEAIKADGVDLLLASTDGECKGFDLCKTVRKGKRPDLPVVLMGESKESESRFAKELNQGPTANGFILLPAATEDIVDWVERLVGLPDRSKKWRFPI